MADKRDRVHAGLTDLYAPGGALRTAPVELSGHFDDAAVARVAKACMELQQNVSAGGRAVVVSAGPPGAGKTEVLGALSLSGFRVIDPDVAKDMLLDEADRHDLLDYRYEFVLPDGGPVGLRELAAHVHTLSIRVTDVVRRLALAAGENVIIDGTLSWRPLTGLYIDELFNAGYEGLEVVDVETSLEIALARTKERWWAGRQDDSRFGGRFVPDEAVKRCYDDGQPTESKCAANALILAERAADELGQGKLRRFDLDAQPGAPRQTLQTNFG